MIFFAKVFVQRKKNVRKLPSRYGWLYMFEELSQLKRFGCPAFWAFNSLHDFLC
jgi:hypothetical protein